jgi:hypothetical protein
VIDDGALLQVELRLDRGVREAEQPVRVRRGAIESRDDFAQRLRRDREPVAEVALVADPPPPILLPLVVQRRHRRRADERRAAGMLDHRAVAREDDQERAGRSIRAELRMRGREAMRSDGERVVRKEQLLERQDAQSGSHANRLARISTGSAMPPRT